MNGFDGHILSSCLNALGGVTHLNHATWCDDHISIDTCLYALRGVMEFEQNMFCLLVQLGVMVRFQ
jgi:hypothetical protein